MGKPIGEHQAIALKLADMATRLEASRLLTRNAAERKAKGLRCDVEAGMAKLFASETALELSMESMRIHGGVGYTTEFPVERYYRDAPLMVIGEGTNEIQRIVIARGLLARARARTELPPARPELGQLLEDGLGVLAEPGRRTRRPDGGVRKADRPVHQALRSAVVTEVEVDEPVIGCELRILEHVRWAHRRGPPHPARSNRSAHTASGSVAMISSSTAIASVRFLRRARASANRASWCRSARPSAR